MIARASHAAVLLDFSLTIICYLIHCALGRAAGKRNNESRDYQSVHLHPNHLRSFVIICAEHMKLGGECALEAFHAPRQFTRLRRQSLAACIDAAFGAGPADRQFKRHRLASQIGVGTQNGPRYTLRFCRAFDGAHLAKRSERGGWRIGIGPEVIAGEIDMLPTER